MDKRKSILRSHPVTKPALAMRARKFKKHCFQGTQLSFRVPSETDPRTSISVQKESIWEHRKYQHGAGKWVRPGKAANEVCITKQVTSDSNELDPLGNSVSQGKNTLQSYPYPRDQKMGYLYYKARLLSWGLAPPEARGSPQGKRDRCW